MKPLKIFIFIMVLLFTVSFVANSEEAKAAAQSASSAPEQKQGTVQEKGAVHDHGPFKEKRFTAAVGPDGVQHVEIIGGEYFFDPNYIVVKVNVPVEFKIKKTPGYIPHNIAVNAPDAGINFKTDMGSDWQIVKFTPTKVGKYEMICDKRLLWFKSHKERGMDGFIEVAP